MRNKLWRQRPLLLAVQAAILLLIVAALIIALDLNRRAQSGQLVGAGEAPLQAEIEFQLTRQVELTATLNYVQSDAYVHDYARGEAGLLLPGEKRVRPLLQEATPTPGPLPEEALDPAHYARPWQAWWQLLTDAPLPTR